MANQFGRAQRWQRRRAQRGFCWQCRRAQRWQCRRVDQCGRAQRGYLSAGVHCPPGRLSNLRTSELQNASPREEERGTPEAERGKEVGRRCCFAAVGSVFAPPESTPSTGENGHQRGHCADGGMSAASALRPSAGIFPCEEAKSDVREPIKGRRRFCGVALVTYEDTNRSRRKICTMRYFGSVASDNSPRELTCRAEKEPIVANHLGRAPRRHCRFGYFSE